MWGCAGAFWCGCRDPVWWEGPDCCTDGLPRATTSGADSLLGDAENLGSDAADSLCFRARVSPLLRAVCIPRRTPSIIAKVATRNGSRGDTKSRPSLIASHSPPGDLGFVAGIRLEGIGSGACGFSLGDDRVDLSARMAFWDFVSLCKSNSNARSRISWDRGASAVALLGSDSALSDSGVASGQRLWGIGSGRVEADSSVPKASWYSCKSSPKSDSSAGSEISAEGTTESLVSSARSGDWERSFPD